MKMTIALVGLMAVVPQKVIAEGPLEVAIVTHQGVGIESVDKVELGRLFLALDSRVGGVRLKAVNLSDKELKRWVLERMTGMSSRQIENHFVQIEIQGEGKWPPEVDSAEELVRLIVKTRNVIGWLPVPELEELPERYRKVLKVISVDGHNPGDRGYPLGPTPQTTTGEPSNG